ncbi:hypothetical protein [Haloarcula sp. JP-L23]|uniref:hypothetical protein n=1 Tax=Haloarcula sp. JP-L23 TaxID=2716717 RepID=UPI00140F167D|nr:hypothetical protein G9465_24950 [Haloarcula sp. JP-L23]
MLSELLPSGFYDVLALISTVISGCLLAIRFKEYIDEKPDLKINSADNCTYTGAEYSSTEDKIITDMAEMDNPPTTHYTLSIELENDGRQPLTISEFQLKLPDCDEILDLSENDLTNSWSGSKYKLESNERQNLDLGAVGDSLSEYGPDISGVLVLDSTADDVEERVTFEHDG